jgi:LysR family transcriptional regulator, chromosome initiation inhibitor
MFDLRQLQALTTVLDEQSFDKAAELLCVSQSAISQRIKTLESQVGQALLIRGNPVKATNAGQQLVACYRKISLLEQELALALNIRQLVADGSPSGILQSQRLSVAIGLNADSLATWFIPVITHFIEQENLLVELKTDDQQRTHELLRTGEVIGCISAINKPLQGCHAEFLGYMTYFPVCSAEFRQKHFQILNRHAFLHAPAVEFNNKDKLQSDYLANHWCIKPGEYPRHQVPSSEAFMKCIVAGLGWGMVPELQAKRPLATGLLERVHSSHVAGIPLYWHVWNLKSELLKKMTKLLQDGARKYLTNGKK